MTRPFIALFACAVLVALLSHTPRTATRNTASATRFDRVADANYRVVELRELRVSRSRPAVMDKQIPTVTARDRNQHPFSPRAKSASAPTGVLARIRHCESGDNYRAVNRSSGAGGAYEFMPGTWRSLRASAGYSRAELAPASVQDAAARELFAKAGTSPWNSSRGCWGRG